MKKYAGKDGMIQMEAGGKQRARERAREAPGAPVLGGVMSRRLEGGRLMATIPR